MPTTVATRIDGLNDPPLSAPNTNLTLLPVAAPATAQRIRAVEFRSTDGRSWSATGGGDTVAAALDWARECSGRHALGTHRLGRPVWRLETNRGVARRSGPTMRTQLEQ